MVRLRGDGIKSTPEQDILRGLEHAARLGLTGVHTDSDLAEIELYNKLKAEGRLSLRVYAWLPVEGLDSYIRKGIRQGQGDDLVRVGFQKVFIDGTLGSGTALMFAPFSDEPGKSGVPQMPEAELDALFEKAQTNGYQTGTHAIGDKGVNWVLNAVEKARRKFGTKDLRHRIEHAQIIAAADVPRFKELGVIASMQPTHCTTDMRFCERRVGKERSKGAYIWRTLLENGTKIAFGSDWPVEPLDPDARPLLGRDPEEHRGRFSRGRLVSRTEIDHGGSNQTFHVGLILCLVRREHQGDARAGQAGGHGRSDQGPFHDPAQGNPHHRGRLYDPRRQDRFRKEIGQEIRKPASALDAGRRGEASINRPGPCRPRTTALP